jgi:hypothetical protein
MTCITTSKRHRQPVFDTDPDRQTSVFPEGTASTGARPARKPTLTLHLNHRAPAEDANQAAAQGPTQLSLLDTESTV